MSKDNCVAYLSFGSPDPVPPYLFPPSSVLKRADLYWFHPQVPLHFSFPLDFAKRKVGAGNNWMLRDWDRLRFLLVQLSHIRSPWFGCTLCRTPWAYQWLCPCRYSFCFLLCPFLLLCNLVTAICLVDFPTNPTHSFINDSFIKFPSITERIMLFLDSTLFRFLTEKQMLPSC